MLIYEDEKRKKVQDLPFEPDLAPLFPADEVVFGFFAGATGFSVDSALGAGEDSPLATGFSFFSGSDFFLNLSKKDIRSYKHVVFKDYAWIKYKGNWITFCGIQFGREIQGVFLNFLVNSYGS
ncbi:MAG: hypothetical protein ACYDAZ_05060 [Thermoplasmataceae archaeon]